MFGSKISRSEILIILITSVAILASFSPFIPVYRKEVLKCNWQKNTCIVYRTRYLGSVETQILMPPNSIDSVGFRGKRIRYGRHQKINTGLY